MNSKSNVLPGQFQRQISSRYFTTDDKDFFTDKRTSVANCGDFGNDDPKLKKRSDSIGSLAKWKTLISLDETAQPNDDFHHDTEKCPEEKTKSHFECSFGENRVKEQEADGNKTLCTKDANMNYIYRHNGKRPLNLKKQNGPNKNSHMLSRKLTRRMTTRQKQKLLMESEFDEFDEDQAGHKHGDRSPNDDVDLSDGSDKEEELDNNLLFRLNMKRLQEEDAADEGDHETNPEMTKVQRIADEFLATERSYVKKLHLLDQIFQMNIVMVNRNQVLFPQEIVPQMFSNIKSIYQFHHDFLLPKLEQVANPQSQDMKVGEVMAWFAPFLKLYIEYVKNFDRASDIISYWKGKSPKFANLLEELQKRPECGNLSLLHHMLEPIQRVPRYELLLKDYLKHLPVASPDREHTEKALKIVREAAHFSNEAMRKIEKFRKLLDLNESLGESVDLISPTRELVKEGKVMRVSAKDGSLMERYMFLFNDLLLVCQLGTIRHYKIKSKMNIDDMEISESHNLETPNCFYIRCKEKSIEIHTPNIEDKLEWENLFRKVIEDYQAKLKSSRIRMTLMFPVVTDQLGKRAPTWVKDNETSMCMRCAVTFSTFRRRHHCRACGLVVCRVCSAYKAKLDFSPNCEDRVCCSCYQVLKNTSPDSIPEDARATIDGSSTRKSEKLKSAKVRLQVKGTAPSVYSGYMCISCDRKNWSRRWFAAHSTFVLFSYKAHQDVVALTSLPLPGYRVKIADPCENEQKQNIFKVFHEGEKKVYYFQVDDINIFFKWIEVLQSLSMLVIPTLDESSRSTATQGT